MDETKKKEEPRKVRGIFERPTGSGIWWIRFADEQGRVHRECAGLKSAARTLYGKRKTEVREGRFFPKVRKRLVTFAELVDEALAHSKTHSCPQHHSINEYHGDVVKGWFKGKTAAEITPQAINNHLQELAEAGKMRATINRYRSFLSLCFKVGLANDKVDRNPVAKVPQLKEDNTRRRFFSSDEELAIKNAIQAMFPQGADELIAEVTLAINTGLRRSELWHLEWADIDLERKLIGLLKTKNGDTRNIPINSAAMMALERLRQSSGLARYVIPGPQDKERGKDERRFFESIFAQAGLSDCCYHTFRHTCCSRLVMKGVPIPAVQGIMGHRTITTTLRYSHLSPEFQHRAIELIADDSKRGGRIFQTDTKTGTSDFERLLNQGVESGQVQ